MKIQIKDFTLMATGNAKEIMDQVEAHIRKENLLFNNIVIDGVEVYENFEEYLQERATENSEMEVITITSEELLNHFIHQFTEIQKELEEEAEELSLLFYRNLQTQENWEQVVLIVEKAYSLLQVAEDIILLQGGIENVMPFLTSENVKELGGILHLFYPALEEREVIYLADLLHFELVAFLLKLQS